MKQRIKGLLSIWLAAAVLLTTLGMAPITVSAVTTPNLNFYLSVEILAPDLPLENPTTIPVAVDTVTAFRDLTTVSGAMAEQALPIGWEIWETYDREGTFVGEKLAVKPLDWIPTQEDIDEYGSDSGNQSIVVPKYALSLRMAIDYSASQEGAQLPYWTSDVSVLPGIPMNDERQTVLLRLLEGNIPLGFHIWKTAEVDGDEVLDEKPHPDTLPPDHIIDETLAEELLEEELADRIPFLDVAFPPYDLLVYMDETGETPLTVGEISWDDWYEKHSSIYYSSWDMSKTISENLEENEISLPKGKLLTGWKLWTAANLGSGRPKIKKQIKNGIESTALFQDSDKLSDADALAVWKEPLGEREYSSLAILEAVMETLRITQQPKAENSYTVLSNGDDSLKTYAWFKLNETITATVADTETETTIQAAPYDDEDSPSSYADGVWTPADDSYGDGYYLENLALREGDVVTITLNGSVENIEVVLLENGEDVRLVEENADGTQAEYTFTIPKDGNYMIWSYGEDWNGALDGTTAAISVTWNDLTLVEGQTTNVFAPANAEDGNYLATITYSNGSKLVSDIFAYTKSDIPYTPSYGGGGGGVSGLPGSTCLVKFDTAGGGLIQQQAVKTGNKATRPDDPKKTDFLFAGWFADEELTEAYDFDTPVTKNITLYAKWDEIPASDDPVVKPPSTEYFFVDVDPDAWYYEAVNYVVDRGLMTGVSAQVFQPMGYLTRGMFITILYRMENEPETSITQIFSDIGTDDWYQKAVAWGYANGIVMGISDTEFAPNLPITREQQATMLYRYASFKGYDISSINDLLNYLDIDEISDYALDAMRYAVGTNLIQGKTSDRLAPQDYTNRAEAATILSRFVTHYEI